MSSKDSILNREIEVVTKFEVLPYGNSFIACISEVWEDKGVTRRNIIKSKKASTREEANEKLSKIRKEFWS